MPAGREMLEGPRASFALRCDHVPVREAVEDPRAVQHRVGRLVEIVVAGGNVTLEMLQLEVQPSLELGPGRRRDDLLRRFPVKQDIAPGEPVRAMERPRLVSTVRT